MALTAKNHDAVQPAERIAAAGKERRSKRGKLYRTLFVWPGALAVLALCLLAFNDVRWRDQLTERDEQIAKLEKELTVRRGEPAPQRCREYGIHMERWSLVHCTKPGLRV